MAMSPEGHCNPQKAYRASEHFWKRASYLQNLLFSAWADSLQVDQGRELFCLPTSLVFGGGPAIQ